jgi:ClpP class serine protease
LAQNDAKKAIDKLARREKADLYLFNSPVLTSNVDRIRSMVCAKKDRKANAILYLTTLGGDPDAGFRLSACMRRHYSSFRIHLGGLCKSAGTLAVIGADEIVYLDFGELGPLDVQIAKPDEL